MKLPITLLTILFYLNGSAQIASDENLIITKLLSEPDVLNSIQRAVKIENFDIISEDGVKVYANPQADSLIEMRVKKFKNKGYGYYKIKVALEEDLLISARFRLLKPSSELIFRKLLIRDAKWLLTQGYLYSYIFQN